MMTMTTDKTSRDSVLDLIADYVTNGSIESSEAFDTARLALADSIGCLALALRFPECTKLLGPVVPGTIVPKGARVPGTSYILDPIRAAFNIGTLIRWLDYNDTWLAAEWGHPSDNLGALIAVTDFMTRNGQRRFTVRDLLTAMIKAYEIQGGLALLNSFNRIGFDHVILVKAASTALSTHLMGGTRDQVADALSHAWIDTGPLRTYRHAPNTGSRKSWAAGDATSRGVQLGYLTLQGEMGYKTPLTAKRWGLYDVLFHGKAFEFQRPLGSYVMENILFKISFPAEFHAQTAVECAIKLHPQVIRRLDDIKEIKVTTHESAIRIIDKKGPLHNPADRDHCLQYMIAIGLLYGTLKADHYEEETARDARIDRLRAKMTIAESPRYSTEYHCTDKRSIANAIQIIFKDGSCTAQIEVEYPVGHRRRRQEGIPLLYKKLQENLSTHFSNEKTENILRIFQNSKELDRMSVSELIDLLI